MTIGEPTTDIFKLAPGVLTVAAMAGVEEFKNREPVYPVDWNPNVESKEAQWDSPQRQDTFYHAYVERRSSLGGYMKPLGFGSAAWVFGYMRNEMLRKMQDDFYSGAEYGIVTMQMPDTESGLTNLITVTGNIIRPSLGDTMQHKQDTPHGYIDVTFNFNSLLVVT